MNGNTDAAKKKIMYMTLYIFVMSMLPGVDIYGHAGSLISGVLLGMGFLNMGPNCLRDDTARKTKILARILYLLYSLALMSIFVI